MSVYHCSDCGGSDGNHFNDCIYDGVHSGSRKLGGDFTEKFVFAIFCVVGVLGALLFPPLGAGIIMLGAKITGV